METITEEDESPKKSALKLTNVAARLPDYLGRAEDIELAEKMLAGFDEATQVDDDSMPEECADQLQRVLVGLLASFKDERLFPSEEHS